MHRISTDIEYLQSGKIIIDADGIPVDVPDRTHMVDADEALGQRIDGKADKVHRHVSDDISDAVSSIAYTPDRLVKTNAEGKLFIPTASITAQGDPANKAYVDAGDATLGQQIDAVLDDPRVPQVKLGTDLSWAVSDGEHVPLAVTKDGSVHLSRVDNPTATLITDEVSERIGITHEDMGVEDDLPFRVSDGSHAALAVTKDGAVDFRRLTPATIDYIAGELPAPEPPTPPAPVTSWVPDTSGDGLSATYVPTGQRINLSTEGTAATAVGDSITWYEGGHQMWMKTPDDGPWQATDLTRMAVWGSSTIAEMHAQLESMLTGAGVTTVLRGGEGGDRATHILARMGVCPFTLAEPTTIPTTGTVELSLVNGPPNGSSQNAAIPGTLGGVRGTFDHRKRYAFTRATAGEAVPIPAGTEFIPDALAFRDAPAIIQIGKNDIAAGDATGQSIVDWSMDAFDWLRTLPKWVLVMGHHINSNYAPTDSRTTRLREANLLCAETFGDRFIDLSGYLCSPQVWDDTGLTPTQDDLDLQAAGIMPAQLSRDGGTHFTTATTAAVANHLIKPHLEKIGWL